MGAAIGYAAGGGFAAGGGASAGALGGAALGGYEGSQFGKGPKPPGSPAVPDQNNAPNAAQAQNDLLRQRRGLLANIYGGALNQSAVVGKTALGT